MKHIISKIFKHLRIFLVILFVLGVMALIVRLLLLHVFLDTQLIIAADRGRPTIDPKKSIMDHDFGKRKVEFIKLECIGSKILSRKTKKIVPYPYHNESDCDRNSHGSFRNLIEGNEKGSHYFFNMAGWTDNQWKLFKIRYNIYIDKLDTDGLSDVEFWCYGTKMIFTGVDEQGKCILSQHGEFCLFELKNRISRYKVSKNRFLHIGSFGAIYSGNDIIIHQELIMDNSGDIDRFFPNVLTISSVDESQCKRIKTGYLHRGFMHTDPYPNAPMAISPDKNCVVFLAFYPEESNDGKIIRMCAWDIKNNTVRKIMTFPFDIWSLHKPSAIVFNPDADKNLLAADTSDGIFLIDIKKCKITKTISDIDECRSLRWSPDGKKLGVMTGDGKLYVYNLKKDNLKLLARDADYFDFFWVK